MPFRTPSGSSAHPRSRGENLREDLSAQRAAGSSPLTRGKLDQERETMTRLRLIPAHAGKTEPQTSSTKPKAAHPRSRGENKPSGALANIAYGSSPLTRGKQW